MNGFCCLKWYLKGYLKGYPKGYPKIQWKPQLLRNDMADIGGGKHLVGRLLFPLFGIIATDTAWG